MMTSKRTTLARLLAGCGLLRDPAAALRLAGRNYIRGGGRAQQNQRHGREDGTHQVKAL